VTNVEIMRTARAHVPRRMARSFEMNRGLPKTLAVALIAGAAALTMNAPQAQAQWHGHWRGGGGWHGGGWHGGGWHGGGYGWGGAAVAGLALGAITGAVIANNSYPYYGYGYDPYYGYGYGNGYEYPVYYYPRVYRSYGYYQPWHGYYRPWRHAYYRPHPYGWNGGVYRPMRGAHYRRPAYRYGYR